MQKILITGGSGFIGTNLIEYLQDKYVILNIDIKCPQIQSHGKYWVNVDIKDLNCISAIFNDFKPDFLIHLAARTDLNGESINDYDSNTDGTSNILKLVKKCETLKKVILASSKFIAPNGYNVSDQFDMCPHTVYGQSKASMEQLIWNDPPNCDWVIIRPTSIWGPYFGEPYRSFFEYIMKGRYFHIGDSKCQKTYGFVGNTVYQIYTLMINDTQKNTNKVYYLGDEPPYDIGNWANEIAGEIGRQLPVVPKPLVRAAAYFGDFLSIFKVRFPMNSFRYYNMTLDGTNDLNEIEEIVPNLPYTRLDGTRITLRWLKARSAKK